MFLPRNSFVTNTTLTHTNKPRGHSPAAPRGNDHIACYGSFQTATTVTWHNSNGAKLEDCGGRCGDCGGKCISNGGVGVDKPDLRITDIHVYTDSPAYMNQDLECQFFNDQGPKAFIGVYLKDGGKFGISTHEWQPARTIICASLIYICTYQLHSSSSINAHMTYPLFLGLFDPYDIVLSINLLPLPHCRGCEPAVKLWQLLVLSLRSKYTGRYK